MSVIMIETQVVGFLFDAQISLESIETKLSYDGVKTRKSTDVVEVKDGVLNIMFHGVGIATTDWEITVTQLQPNKELFKKKGTTGSTGHSLVFDAVTLPKEKN
jgi:hypothetical protein